MRWGGGGTPSIDEPDGEKKKSSPQPIVDVVIPDEEKIRWVDKLYHSILGDIVVDPGSVNFRGNELPEGFTQIEYLESTGTQRIDAGITPDENSRVVTKENISSGLYGTASWSNATPAALRWGLTDNLQNYRVITQNDSGQRIIASYDGLPHIFDINVKERKLVFDENVGSPIALQSNYSIPPFSLHLFATKVLNGSNTQYYYGKTKLYYCKIYDDGVLVRDFIPCYSEDYVAGLYDVVDGQFYTNQGSGKFNLNRHLEGNGTSKNPYKISSEMDLAYLSYSAQSNTGVWNEKYFELTEDILFNDGYFEEDGTYHDGGDGKLYEWTPIVSGWNATIFGNGHTIQGLYINRPSNSNQGLFGSTANLSRVENLNFTKVFVKGYDGLYSLAYNVNNLSHIKVLDGYIIGRQNLAGVCRISNSLAEYCYNKAKIISSAGYNGGLFVTSNGVVKNCENYGDINAAGTAGWIALYGKTFEKCENHGNLSGGGQGFAGISNDAQIIEGCVNYGKVPNSYNNTGAIANTLTKRMKNCANFDPGNSMVQKPINCQIIDCKTVDGEIIASTSENTTNNEVILMGCEVKSKNGRGLVARCGYAQTNNTLKIRIENCIVDFSETTGSGNALLEAFQFGISVFEFQCSNVKVIMGSSVSQKLIGDIQKKGSNVNIRNILIETSVKPTVLVSSTTTSRANLSMKNILINDPNGSKEYYGTDFSAFFYTWKEDRIGLISLERNGLYRGQVDESYLYRHGFTAMDHVYEPTEEDAEYRRKENQRKFNQDYVQLEYLQSTGTQWIDTGISGGVNPEFFISFSFTGTNGSGWHKIFGTKEGSDYFTKLRTYGDKFYCWVNKNHINEYKENIIFNYDYSFELVKEMNLYNFYVNNELIGSYSDEHNWGTQNIVFGSSSSQAGDGGYSKIKLYSLSMKTNGNLVRNFVPAQRKSDNVLGLFDRVEGKFYTNQGTGTFLGA